MGSYLEAYGSHEELRAKRTRAIKVASLCVVLAALVGTILFFTFRNFSEENQAKTFLTLLRNQQYQDAYQMWGCTEAHPCPNYPFTAFRDDWEPSSTHTDAATATIGDVDSCGSGVLIQVNYAHSKPVALWVERGSSTISFSPWPECPGKHWRFSAFFKSLLGK